MAVTIRTSIVVTDQEPRANSPVSVGQREDDDHYPLIAVLQGDDLILMTPDHARAVADTILSLTNSTAKE